MVNELRFGFNRSTQGTYNGDIGVPATAYGLNTGVTDPQVGGLPQILITGGGSFLGSWTGPPGFAGPNPFYRVADNVSYFRGKHAFKFGGEIARADVNSAGKGGERGTITFKGGQAFAGSSALEDFLAGKPTRAQLPFGSDPARNLRRWQYAGFASGRLAGHPKVDAEPRTALRIRPGPKRAKQQTRELRSDRALRNDSRRQGVQFRLSSR